MDGEHTDLMDIWTYLKALLRLWWLVVLITVAAFVLAFFVFFPSAPWQVSWNTLITFEGNPAKASSFNYVDFIVLDDMEHLLASDVVGDQVYLNLPEEIASQYSREQIGAMYSTYRHARFVEINVTGMDPDVVQEVARTTERVLPEAVNEYLIPADNPDYPGKVETMDRITAPERLTNERLLKVGAVTSAGAAVSLCIVAAIEWLPTSYRLKYGAR